ncbi:hypothetical protein [Angelakisella massiliensis]|uniref:hypothetical protein n=1 Tax=Angelakisella massiliensis TaxID=1871018 RepID=UPI0024B233B2|nr:hypothetical protein [Angelakisella massiliensis]
MKKVLALVLAVAMMATLAFAVEYKEPGSSLKLGATSFEDDKGNAVPVSDVDFNEDNFVISTKKITKGASYVDSIAFNDDDQLVIKFKQDYTLTTSKVNVTISELAVKAKKTIKDDDTTILKKNDEYSYAAGKIEIELGWDKSTVAVTDADAEINLTAGDALYVEFDKDEDATAGSNKGSNITVSSGDPASYMTTEIDFEGEAYAEGRVYDGDEVFYGFNMDADTDILKAYPDAEMRFFEIEGNGFPTTLSFELYAAEDEYVYAVKDGKLTNSGLKWDEDVYAWTGKVRSAVQYVISDIELDTTAVDTGDGDTTTENPATGANDVVGVATALAVVSLVAAGAVSLKK